MRFFQVRRQCTRPQVHCYTHSDNTERASKHGFAARSVLLGSYYVLTPSLKYCPCKFRHCQYFQQIFLQKNFSKYLIFVGQKPRPWFLCKSPADKSPEIHLLGTFSVLGCHLWKRILLVVFSLFLWCRISRLFGSYLMWRKSWFCNSGLQ